MKYLTEDDIADVCISYGCYPNQRPMHPDVENKCQKLLNHFNSKIIDSLIQLEKIIQEKYPSFDMNKSLKFKLMTPFSFNFKPNIEMAIEDYNSYRSKIYAIFEKYFVLWNLDYV